jgi:hypothetical protein
MAELIEIPKIYPGEDWYAKSPGWSPVTQAGHYLKPLIRCNCGRWSGIGLHHVHADGTVTASFYHKRGNIYPEDPNGCEWHVFIKLKDYDLGDFPPEK